MTRYILEDRFIAWIYANYPIGNGEMLITKMEDPNAWDNFLKDNDLPLDTEMEF